VEKREGIELKPLAPIWLALNQNKVKYKEFTEPYKEKEGRGGKPLRRENHGGSQLSVTLEETFFEKDHDVYTRPQHLVGKREEGMRVVDFPKSAS